jgi:glycosyltransferase involved in cell wall biosynthesis
MSVPSNSERFPISVIVLTFNEEVNIGACLDSVAWAEDVMVVDSVSADRTVELARQTRPDARVFSHAFQDFGDQRNWALDNAGPKHEWILFLDADERCTAECAAAIRQAVQSPADKAGFFLCARNFFLGRWLRHCALYPSFQLRLLRSGHVRYRREGHGQREVTDEPLGYLRVPYDHYPLSKGIREWVSRHNGYTSAELELIRRMAAEPVRVSDLFLAGPVGRRRCLKRIAARMPWLRLLVFGYLYGLRLGFLDGWPGLLFCLLRLANEIHVVAKLGESRWIEKRGRR